MALAGVVAISTVAGGQATVYGQVEHSQTIQGDSIVELNVSEDDVELATDSEATLDDIILDDSKNDTAGNAAGYENGAEHADKNENVSKDTLTTTELADDAEEAPLKMAEEGCGLSVVGDDGAEAEFEDGVWKLADGNYTVSGEAKDDESLRIDGAVTVTLKDVSVLHETVDEIKYAPAISIQAESDVTLVLSGDNHVQGSAGYAGIFVADGAELTITGDGSLDAHGGDGSGLIRNVGTTVDFGFGSDVKSLYFGAGAGIGGNGIWMTGSDNIIGDSTADFGSIMIESGTISVFGGKANINNAGGGAGIGGGGNTTKAEEGELPANGQIDISGGMISATGGDGENNSLTGGGAGIGAGGAIGGFYTGKNNIEVTIHSGDITAKGMADGAGIGGGANADGGIIKILGGTVDATGGCELDDGVQDGCYGGAGIGGGDNGGVTSIEITGGDVTARAIGTAAGIGSGNDWGVGVEADDDTFLPGSILIGGDASVIAYGGSGTSRGKNFGGAGIGAGRSYYNDSGCGNISIIENAEVYAYAGPEAQAIGVGSFYEGNDANSLNIDDTITLWAQTQDTTWPALLSDEHGDVHFDSSAVYLFIDDPGNTGYVNCYSKWPSEEADDVLPYNVNDENRLSVDGYVIDVAKIETPLGNWATLYKTQSVTVTYDYVGEIPKTAVLPTTETVSPKAGYTAVLPAAVSGYRFDGWYTDPQCKTKFENSTVLSSDITLYGRWLLETTEVTPVVAAYKVEYYKQQADGSYVLAETEFPLYAEIGSAVVAPEKEYDGYVENLKHADRVVSGIVVMPESDASNVLVLKRFYDKKTSGETNTSSSSHTSGGHGHSGNSNTASSVITGEWMKLSDTDRHWTFKQSNASILKDCWAYLKNPYASANQPVNSWFRFDANGDLSFGWYRDNFGKWYWLHDKTDGILGAMQTGWHKDNQDGRWYYLAPDSGEMLTGWQMINGKWYYFNENAPQPTWECVNGEWKFTGTDQRPYGSMFQDEQTPDGYYVDDTGVRNEASK